MPALGTVAVVGASLAGLRAVETLRRSGYEGRLVLVGAEDALPYDRPPLSKELLAGEWDVDEIHLRPPGGYDDLDLDLRLGVRAIGLDVVRRRLHLDTGDEVAFDAALVATGVSPRRLPGTPDLEGIHTLRTLEDSLRLRDEIGPGARVVVVGAGFIGSEVAWTSRRRGADVTVLEALPVPLLGALGAEMGRACAALHLDHGVDLRCGVTVEGFVGDHRVDGGRVRAVRLAGDEVVPADVVVVGVGVAPVTDWLASSGLTLADGIVCDERCFAAPGVLAAGDVARWYNPLFDEEMRVEHWTNAAEQGMAAARNLLAGPQAAEPYAPVPYFWSDQYDVTIQFAGRSAPDGDVVVAHGSVEARTFVTLYGRAGRLVGVLGIGQPRLVTKYRRMIAARTSWDDALEAARSA